MRLPAALSDRVDRLAADRGVPRGEVVAELLAAALDGGPRPLVDIGDPACEGGVARVGGDAAAAEVEIPDAYFGPAPDDAEDRVSEAAPPVAGAAAPRAPAAAAARPAATSPDAASLPVARVAARVRPAGAPPHPLLDAPAPLFAWLLASPCCCRC